MSSSDGEVLTQDEQPNEDLPCAKAGSQPILRLPEDVVNRIAAGEIIHRPANALKEMIENSLDAGATMIRVHLRDGGLKLLQIQDDGHGVAPTDLPLLCERFATSKLRSFGDLSKMTTFGFRGEALASISYVSASMSVVSRTAENEVAFKASYSYGKLAAPKPGQSVEPRPCAGSKGTFITAEDLFYNVPQRKRALKSASEEYSLALDVMGKYAVHYGARGVGFSCKKANSSMMDLSVPSDVTLTAQDVISIIYGNKVAKQLVLLGPTRDDSLCVSTTGWISGPNWTSSKRAMFILFINNRLVDSPALRRALLALYAAILPKGSHPWIYLSLQIDEANVDVNVHPTKREVHFLHEEDIIETICTYVQDKLTHADVGRSYATVDATQSVLMPHPTKEASNSQMQAQSSSSGRVAQTPGYPQHTVRVDHKMRTLESMGAVIRTDRRKDEEPTQKQAETRGEDSNMIDYDVAESGSMNDEEGIRASETDRLWVSESVTSLKSIYELRRTVRTEQHAELTEILRQQSFVGIVDTTLRLLLLQHRTKLYLVHYAAVIEQLAYQLLLRQFGQFGRISLQPAPFLDDVLRAALEAEPAESHKRRLALGITEARVMKHVCKVLCTHADMLSEYFAIGIERDAEAEHDNDASRVRITTLPNVFGVHGDARNLADDINVMQLERIPTFLLRLALEVDFTQEKDCFHTILCELAMLHVPLPSLREGNNGGATDGNFDRVGAIGEAPKSPENSSAYHEAERSWTRIWQPAMRFLYPSNSLANDSKIVSVASLPSLYSIFERC